MSDLSNDSDPGAPRSGSARDAVRAHGDALTPARRRSLGSHATPEDLAGDLVELALDHLGRMPERVLDPSCGAGSFLLAAADALVRRGADPADVVGRLEGWDVDPTAVLHCREALRRWGDSHGVRGAVEARIVRRDGLTAGDELRGSVDLVVGNPPFLAQRTLDTGRSAPRRAELRLRFGPLGAYVDDAAVFLLVAAGLLAPGGVAVMVQPRSTLSARDAGAVRDRLVEMAPPVAAWADDGRHFAADVDVWAPVLRRGAPVGRGVEVHWGSGRRVARQRSPRPGESWSPLLAAALGVPGSGSPDDRVRVDHRPGAGASGIVGDVAVTTAGFRDEFYALCAAARSSGDPGWAPDLAPLVTVGMIDLGRLDPHRPRRLGGRSVIDPRLDRSCLDAEAPTVAAWVRKRLVPKVLVATQTRVIEAVADPRGVLVPVTPTISVEPSDADGPGPWELLAAICAPPSAATLARDAAGSGLSPGAVRVSAASLRSLPLPSDSAAWAEGAALAAELQTCDPAERPGRLQRFGEVMIRSHGPADPGLLDWWLPLAVGRGGTGAEGA